MFPFVSPLSTFAVYPLVSLRNDFACWLEFYSFREKCFFCCVAALLLVVYLLLYELNVLCIAIILTLFAFSAL